MLTGCGVVLLPFEKQFVERARTWINREDVREGTGTEGPVTELEQKHWYKRLVKDRRRRTFVIAQQGNDAPVPIGIIGFANVDMRNRSAEYWIYLGEPTAQRQGIATRASVRMLEFGFDTIGLHRIYLSVLETNASAIGLYEKLGFIREGISREQAFAHGRFWNLIQYSLLDEEFRQRYASMVEIV